MRPRYNAFFTARDAKLWLAQRRIGMILDAAGHNHAARFDLFGLSRALSPFQFTDHGSSAHMAALGRNTSIFSFGALQS